MSIYLFTGRCVRKEEEVHSERERKEKEKGGGTHMHGTSTDSAGTVVLVRWWEPTLMLSRSSVTFSSQIHVFQTLGCGMVLWSDGVI